MSSMTLWVWCYYPDRSKTSGKWGRDTRGDRGGESVTQTLVSCFRAPLPCLLRGIFVNDVNNKCKFIVLFGMTAMSHCCSWLLKQAGDDSWSNISLPRSQPHLQLVCVWMKSQTTPHIWPRPQYDRNQKLGFTSTTADDFSERRLYYFNGVFNFAESVLRSVFVSGSCKAGYLFVWLVDWLVCFLFWLAFSNSLLSTV